MIFYAERKEFQMMKKSVILCALLLALTGCGAGADIDELISAQELPEYSSAVELEINEDGAGEAEPIDIDE